MRQVIGGVFAAILVLSPCSGIRADEASAVLDKAIKAIGGEEKLGKVKATNSKGKGKFSFSGMESEFTNESIFQGLDHMRGGFEGEFGGNKIQAVAVIAGDKGWRKFGDMKMDMDADALANEKRSIYLQVSAMLIVPLKGKGFKVEAAGEEKVGGKAAAILKVTGPDGKDFTLSFDKESGLPVKQVAKVVDFMGAEFTQETYFSDYKQFDGIKKATKVENKRDGETFITVQTTEFKVLDKVDPKTFAEPE